MGEKENAHTAIIGLSMAALVLSAHIIVVVNGIATVVVLNMADPGMNEARGDPELISFTLDIFHGNSHGNFLGNFLETDST